jgi:hypothetical protein
VPQSTNPTFPGSLPLRIMRRKSLEIKLSP